MTDTFHVHTKGEEER